MMVFVDYRLFFAVNYRLEVTGGNQDFLPTKMAAKNAIHRIAVETLTFRRCCIPLRLYVKGQTPGSLYIILVHRDLEWMQWSWKTGFTCLGDLTGCTGLSPSSASHLGSTIASLLITCQTWTAGGQTLRPLSTEEKYMSQVKGVT